MRKGRDGGEKWKKNEMKKKIMAEIVATTLLSVDRPNADRLERRTLMPKDTPVQKVFGQETRKPACIDIDRENWV